MNQGNITFDAPGIGANSAVNGLSVENSQVVLGDNGSGAAVLLTDRFIPFANFFLQFLFGSADVIQFGAGSVVGFTNALQLIRNNNNIALEFTDVGFAKTWAFFADNNFLNLFVTGTGNIWNVNEVIQTFSIPNTTFVGQVAGGRQVLDAPGGYGAGGYSDSDQVTTNFGAVGAMNFNLTDQQLGAHWVICNVAGQPITVSFPAGTSMINAGVTKVSPAVFTSAAVGDSISITFIGNNLFIVTAVVGAWI